MRNKCVITIALGLVYCLSLNAQYRKSDANDFYHFGYVSAGVGYTSLQTDINAMRPYGNVGGLVGVGYEFRKNNAWMSVGVQFEMHRSSGQITQDKIDMDGKDTQGKDVTLHYRIDQTDKYAWNFIEVPVLVGYYNTGFYVGVGPKISYALSPTVSTSGTYELSATNKNIGEEFRNMPEHGYTNYEFSSEQEIYLRPLVSVIGEIGYDVLSKLPTRSLYCSVLKIGFYFEYGINSMLKPVEDTHFEVDRQGDEKVVSTSKVTINPYLSSAVTTQQRAVPFYTGIKITYMFGGSAHGTGTFHHGCQCYQ